MINAVDTNILLDVLTPDEPYRQASEEALTAAASSGPLLLCEAVYAELSPHFSDWTVLDEFLTEIGASLDRTPTSALFRAGQSWVNYLRRRPATLTCPQCGTPQQVQCDRCNSVIQSRQHMVADFIIGAHALVQADRLLTRDRGFYATYFPELTLG